MGSIKPGIRLTKPNMMQLPVQPTPATQPAPTLAVQQASARSNKSGRMSPQATPTINNAARAQARGGKTSGFRR